MLHLVVAHVPHALLAPSAHRFEVLRVAGGSRGVRGLHAPDQWVLRGSAARGDGCGDAVLAGVMALVAVVVLAG